MRGGARPAQVPAVLLLPVLVVVVVASFCRQPALAFTRLPPLSMVRSIARLQPPIDQQHQNPKPQNKQSHTRAAAAAKRAKTTGGTTQQLAMALYQGKAGSSLLETMTEAVAQGMFKK